VEEIGLEQAYLFGLKTSEIDAARQQRRSGSYQLDPRLENVLHQIEIGTFGPGFIFLFCYLFLNGIF
jgi:glucan phosphorylase